MDRNKVYGTAESIVKRGCTRYDGEGKDFWLRIGHNFHFGQKTSIIFILVQNKELCIEDSKIERRQDLK